MTNPELINKTHDHSEYKNDKSDKPETTHDDIVASKLLNQSAEYGSGNQNLQNKDTSPFLPWECLLCTFINDSSSSVCAMCSTPSAIPRMSPLIAGKVKSFNQKTRYGFIKPADGSPEVFVRRNDV